MAMTQTMTARRVAKAFGTLTPGINWYGCAKGHIATRWAIRCDVYGPGIAKITVEQLKAAFDEVERKP